MSEMVERVARAIRGRVRSQTGALPWPEDDSCWPDIASAALAELREPTEAMANKASDEIEMMPDLPVEFAEVWRCMVDEAMR